jgi:putative hydrolase of the HAD superfamily
MQKPKMILFDYGFTLVEEKDKDNLKGIRAVMEYAVKNPRRLTPEQVAEFSENLFAQTCHQTRRGLDIDLCNLNFQNLLYESLEIEFSVPPLEIERIVWDASSFGKPVPHIAALLDFLKESGIRTGVVSNTGASGAGLKVRIDRLLPNHSFEFILASCEYLVCKPNPLFFKIALNKAGLKAEDVWFCGDDVRCDVEGSGSVGMFPVWYRENPASDETPPEIPHLCVQDWRTLQNILKEL